MLPHDPTIYPGLRLSDGANYDTEVERVAYGGFGVIAFGPNRLRLQEQPMVAYKTLRRTLLADAQTRASFVRECLLWIGLWPHANIARAYAVHEIFDAQGPRPFITLAYAEQGNLRNLLTAAHRAPQGRLSLERGLHLAQQIAAGLAYLHQPDPTYLRDEPTVHRDLKPENVLLHDGGRAAITDFGLAKAVQESEAALALLLDEAGGAERGGAASETAPLAGEEATQTAGLRTAAGIALGTAAYMPAEQWTSARDVGTPADVYALGIMLSELLAGRHALLDLDLPHSRAAWKQAHLAPQPRSLQAVEPRIPARIEALYRRCLAADPAQRPSAQHVLTELQAGAAETGVAVYSPPEVVSHILYNEYVTWHQWSNAYFRFKRYDEALARSDRALPLARQLVAEQPDELNALGIALLTRGNILKGMGTEARTRAETARQRSDQAGVAQAEVEAVAADAQAEAAYQESLTARPPVTTPEGRRGRAYVWHQLGGFHSQRQRYAQAEEAYAQTLALQPDMAITYYDRAVNLRQWGVALAEAGEQAAGIAKLRQARVHALTSLRLGDPTARQQIVVIEKALAQHAGPAQP